MQRARRKPAPRSEPRKPEPRESEAKSRGKPPPTESREQAQQRAIYQVVRAIPRGKVASYGQVAELAGIHLGHRIAARAMRSCPERLPWQRVVGKKDARRAQLNIADPEHASLQRKLLEKEGVVFDAQGFIVLARFGWLPT
jgi:methylated-DNA-protein-cysteine methyltransferase-like protein